MPIASGLSPWAVYQRIVGGQTFLISAKGDPSPAAAQAFDAALLINAALRTVKGGSADKVALQKAFKTADVNGTRGKLVFNNNHFPVQDDHV